jgi:hypothetical protein
LHIVKNIRIFALLLRKTKKRIMSNLLRAMQTKDTLTTNGMATNSTSLNHCVNLFFQIGAMRGKDKKELVNIFVKAVNEDALTAIKLLFWARDIRGGAGERKIFRDLIKYLANNYTDLLRNNIKHIPEYGRWDDLLELIGTNLENDALEYIKKGIEDKNGLCCKWLPRPNVKNRERKRYATVLRNYLKLSPKEYRKVIVENSNTVEQLMCSKEWSAIQYSKLPSKAMSDYMKAFSRNDLTRFQEYLGSLEKGETKINAGAVYPYDVVKNLRHGVARGANAQWNALPNYLEGNNEILLPVVDSSGSMNCSAGGNAKITCLDIAISLGLYISERNVGVFKDSFITFSSRPKIQTLKGSLAERCSQLETADWEQNTNLEAVFTLILDSAVKHKLAESDMPTMILILSDMQFDSATSVGWNSGSAWNPTAQELIEHKYTNAGYKVPKIVYWNLNSKNTDTPVQYDKKGTCLVSGFSPALLKNMLAGKDLSPISMMMTVVNSERYNPITI